MDKGWLILIGGGILLLVYIIFREKNETDQADELEYTKDQARLENTSDQADPFLDDIVTAKQRTDSDVEESVRAHEKSLEAQFSKDIELANRLSEFAFEQELDVALIEVQEELLVFYPNDPKDKHADFDKYDSLKVSDFEGSESDDKWSFSFSFDGQRYTITVYKHWEVENFYTDYSLYEGGVEVFGIRKRGDGKEVTAFRKQGKWALVLLELHRRVRISFEKTSKEIGYRDAKEIEGRFTE